MSRLTVISKSKGVRRPDQLYYKYDDMFTRARHIPYLRQRAQAKFRNEPFELTFEQFCEFWDTEEKWAKRGRLRDDLTLTRIDFDLPWSVANCEIITRYEQLCRSSFLRKGMIYNIPDRKGTPKNAK